MALKTTRTRQRQPFNLSSLTVRRLSGTGPRQIRYTVQGACLLCYMRHFPMSYRPSSRHLAEKWSASYLDPRSKRRFLRDPSSTELTTIEHLILLDLLGSSHPTVHSSYPETGWLFDELLSAETKLGEGGHLTGPALAVDRYSSFFRARTGFETPYNYIGDDHTPFLSRGVNVLHIIANPFPRVWHQLSVGHQYRDFLDYSLISWISQDDATALDSSAMRQWNLIMRVFLAGYLNLIPDPSHAERAHEELVRNVLR